MPIASDVRQIEIQGHSVRVAVRRASPPTTPLLLFNGIGSNLELLQPFIEALGDIETVIFDVPGAGASPPPLLPYRFSGMARMANRLMTELGYTAEFDVFGVSWGGGLAQQFAFQHRRRCRKLVLAATCQGALMFPGRLRSLMKMANPQRFVDRDYLTRIGPELYGGAMRTRPDLLAAHSAQLQAPRPRGYAYQLLAAWGWTSLWRLPWLRQPTLILAGTDDPLMPVINARLMSSLIPDARLHLVDDGHLFIATRAVEMAQVVQRFLAEDTPATKPALEAVRLQ
ncbi:MAG TPA: poly(3-hydroxyalkanoate) depolymerase [Rhodoblastus sp.]|nr:poly(3-hydroxyalkanoate) depolymerase [Rhodoblastus sp.]